MKFNFSIIIGLLIATSPFIGLLSGITLDFCWTKPLSNRQRAIVQVLVYAFPVLTMVGLVSFVFSMWMVFNGWHRWAAFSSIPLSVATYIGIIYFVLHFDELFLRNDDEIICDFISRDGDYLVDVVTGDRTFKPLPKKKRKKFFI